MARGTVMITLKALQGSHYHAAQTARHAAIGIINFYQRRLSPHKGFQCAHAVVHGGASCSTYVKESISRDGLLRGAGLARTRFAACHAASREWKMMMAAPEGSVPGKRETPGERTRRCAVFTPATCCLTGFVFH